MSKRRIIFPLVLCLSAVLVFSALAANAQAVRRPIPNSRPGQGVNARGAKGDVFPYELVNYTQSGHEYRIMNSPVVVLGRIEEFHKIEGTEKSMNYSGWLTVEEILRGDRDNLMKRERIYFRCLPLGELYEPIEAGDRCVLLLGRDLRHDNALILPTDMHYYPVTEGGMVRKLMKSVPTRDEPKETEVLLSAFLEELRDVIWRCSLEKQARDSDLVMIGRVVKSEQGTEGNASLFYVDIQPEKIYRGESADSLVGFVQRLDINRYTIQVLNRSSFKGGERILCFGNKDPTLSQRGSWNPDGRTLYRFPVQRLSSLFLASTTAWRRGVQPIPLEKLYEDLEQWTGSTSPDN